MKHWQRSELPSLGLKTQTKPPSNESTTPTLNPLRVDRAPALRGAGLFAVALGARGLGGVTPVHPYLSAASRYPKTQPKARDPRSAKPNPLSGDQTPSNRINYFQTPSGPLRFFTTGRVQRPQQPVRGAVMLVRKTCSMGFWHAPALHKAAFDGVMSEKL